MKRFRKHLISLFVILLLTMAVPINSYATQEPEPGNQQLFTINGIQYSIEKYQSQREQQGGNGSNLVRYHDERNSASKY